MILKKDPKPQEQVPSEEIKEKKKRNTSLVQEKVKNSIDEFIEQNKLSNSTISLLKNEFEIVEGTTIEFKLKNSLENKFLVDIEVDLTAFLRDKLENDHLLVSTKFDKINVVKGAYTNAEIFEEMAAKNPDLLKLKEGLGLDPDF